MRTVDLFAGCGGMSLGFERAGFKIMAAYDSWDSAVDCYRKNFQHLIYNFDLSNSVKIVDEIQRWKPEIIIGGPPCQDFSHAGKRKEGNRANLTMSYANIVLGLKPKWFVMENVDRSIKSEAFAKARVIFKKGGYGLTEKVLNASYCGVPQTRKRFFCIGRLSVKDGFLDGIISSMLKVKPMTVRDYLKDELDIDYYYRHPRNYNRRAVFSIDQPAPTIRGVNRPVAKGYLGHIGDIAPITNKLRPLTTIERARIQTFPKSFKWIGSKTDQEQMIGNAVPVNLAKFVAMAIMNYESKLKNKLPLTQWSK